MHFILLIKKTEGFFNWQNTAVMEKEGGTYDFMVRFEIKDSSHNKPTVLDKTKGILKT